MKSFLQAAAGATVIALVGQYSVIDADGHVVGTLVAGDPAATRLRIAGLATSATAAPVQPNRSFHPDFSHALSVDQMTRALQQELDRLNPPLVTGG